jgi:hypothetical protein
MNLDTRQLSSKLYKRPKRPSIVTMLTVNTTVLIRVQTPEYRRRRDPEALNEQLIYSLLYAIDEFSTMANKKVKVSWSSRSLVDILIEKEEGSTLSNPQPPCVPKLFKKHKCSRSCRSME